jgi:hypothetical protein
MANSRSDPSLAVHVTMLPILILCWSLAKMCNSYSASSAVGSAAASGTGPQNLNPNQTLTTAQTRIRFIARLL